ncbi:C-8 sterol isomerase [Aspergillus flavus AF70]|nr:C-8 sterol isomerase [Aspergillus flavus AF70]
MPSNSSGNKMSASGCSSTRAWDQLYIFDPEHLRDLSQHAIKTYGEDTRSIVNFIVAELQEKVGEKYLNTVEEWVFNNARGAMGAMYIIHTSITEYLIIFDTAIGTEGHTGRHTADD